MNISACDAIRNVIFSWCNGEENYRLLVKLMRDFHLEKTAGHIRNASKYLPDYAALKPRIQ